MEKLIQAGRHRETFWLEMALAVGAIGWGIYTLTWFVPILPVKGMPTGRGWSVESVWGGAAILIGLGQCTTYWYGPSRIFTMFGLGLWAGVALMFSMTNSHGLSSYNYAYVAAIHAALIVRMCRTWIINGWAATLDAFDALAQQERDEDGR